MNKDQEDMLIHLAESIEAGEQPNVEHLNKLPTLNVINALDLQSEPVKSREWLIEGWLPVGCVTSLCGDGGVGKSLLALQVGTAIATGNKIFGFDTKQAKVLAIFCEDDKNEIHRRQAARFVLRPPGTSDSADPDSYYRRSRDDRSPRSAPRPRLQPHRGEGRARHAGSSELRSCRPGHGRRVLRCGSVRWHSSP